jgi:hypothetical protein
MGAAGRNIMKRQVCYYGRRGAPSAAGFGLSKRGGVFNHRALPLAGA